MATAQNSKERDRFQLYMLKYVHAAGLVDVLQRYVQNWTKNLQNSESPETREQFAWFEREADRCAAVEAEHGKGSLLNLNHRFVRSSMTGTRVITPAEFVAAQRYQNLTEKAA